MRHDRRIKNALVLLLGLALAGLGTYNLVAKATWSLLDDGVYWSPSPGGLVATQVQPSGPGGRAGVKLGDLLLAVDGQAVLDAVQLERRLEEGRAGQTVRYSLLRVEARAALDVTLQPLPTGNVTLFFYLSTVGFFSLVMGTIVMLRRPFQDRAARHFYAICALFFLMYSTSFTGRLDLADWVLLWTDHLAILFLPVVFLHFCLSFPERRLSGRRALLVPAAYLPPALLAIATLVAQAGFLRTGGRPLFWQLLAAIDRWKPLYFALLFAVSLVALVSAYRRSRSLTARKQMKWLVWGTGAGVLPFLTCYAIPFALGREPRLAMELLGYIPLALIPLSLAYAVVKHRLMDVELIFRRTLVSVVATAALVGIGLLVVGLTDALLSDDEPHRALIAVVSALAVALLFSPLKRRIQDGIDRLFLRERYNSRRALLRLSQDLNGSLELARTTELLQQGVIAALGVQATAIFLKDPNGDFSMFTSRGSSLGTDSCRLPSQGALLRKLAEGQPVNAEASPDDYPEAGPLNLSHYYPCRVKGEVIAVLAVGRKDGLDGLNSEEHDLLQALAGQAATAFMNGRLYQSLREKAEALERLTEYNQNILECMDAGILVLDLEGRIVRWNRAIETLYGQRRDQVLGRTLAEVFPEAFLEALRSSLVLEEREEELAHIYKLELASAHGRSLRVNVAVAPFELESGERHGTILILDDVTARVRLEEQLQHSEKMASIGVLAAGVAHEVNTPLAGISSYTQLLREQVDASDPRSALLEKIEKQTFRAAKIVNSLLNFSRTSSGEMETLEVNKLVLDVLSLVEHQLQKAHIGVRREFTAELPRVRGNENRLQQVIFNLILNARDALPHGGWLTLGTRTADDDTVVIEVKDTGIGIGRDDMKRIYDPFFTTKGHGRGTGLGLSVSYGIVQEHGGAIFVESAPGQGTSFAVALPALVAPAAYAAAGTHA